VKTRRMLTLAFALGLVPALGACDRDTDVDDNTVPPASETTAEQSARVTDVELGRSIDAQGRIADDADTDDFGARDTIYVSVNTDGSASGSRLTARWTFQDGQVVDESSQNLSVTGPSTTHFHISKPDGFPVGNYKVEIQLDGRTVETKDFEVK
jgi:hypothetical protein